MSGAGNEMTHTTTHIDTKTGRIAVNQSRADGPAIVMIHGNSSCKEVFAPQFEAAELAPYRLVAFDLPGHGQSEDARIPQEGYTFAGYAETVEELCAILGLTQPVLFGWSLGGHIALEMIGRGFDAGGVMISGTPPVTPELESLMAGFNIDPSAENLTGKRDFSDSDALAYGTHTSAVDGHLDPHLLAMVKRTDGRAREIMFGSVVQGQALDEREIVARTRVPFAIVNGEDDVFIRPEYFERLQFGSIWPQGVIRLPGAAHAPFRQQPAQFNRLLVQFAQHAGIA